MMRVVALMNARSHVLLDANLSPYRRNERRLAQAVTDRIPDHSITFSYYSETMARYFGGNAVGLAYRFVFLPFTVIGVLGGLKFVWSLQTLLLGVATIPNLIAILLLSPKVFQLTREFFSGHFNSSAGSPCPSGRHP